MESMTSKSCTNYTDITKKRIRGVCKSQSTPAQSTGEKLEDMSGNKGKSQLVANKTEEETSKRPVKCLFHKCMKYVAIPDITSHFWCEHDDISMIAGDGDNFHMWVSPNSLPINSSTCIALILLVNSQNLRQDKLCKKNITLTDLNHSLPAFVMAGKMHVGTKEPAVLFWVSEAEPQLHCSIHATQFSSRDVSVSYSGPTNNLRLDQNLQGVLERGYCAVVLPNIVQTLAQLTGGFDITIHLKTV